MNLRPRQRQEPDVNLTPLIDVVFLLLIFFMVSTTFLKEADFKIDLPESSQEPGAVEQRRLEVVVDARGRYFVNGQALADSRLTTLRKALAEAAGDDRSLPFIIRADARTPHQAVVIAMDAAAQLGFDHLAIATVQPGGGQTGLDSGE